MKEIIYNESEVCWHEIEKYSKASLSTAVDDPTQLTTEQLYKLLGELSLLKFVFIKNFGDLFVRPDGQPEDITLISARKKLEEAIAKQKFNENKRTLRDLLRNELRIRQQPIYQKTKLITQANVDDDATIVAKIEEIAKLRSKNQRQLEATKAWQKANAKKISQYQKTRRDLRLATLRERLGGKCANCGSTEKLHFHHKNPSTKLFSISAAVASSNMDALIAEVDKCELLCKVCHSKQTSAQWRQLGQNTLH